MKVFISFIAFICLSISANASTCDNKLDNSTASNNENLDVYVYLHNRTLHDLGDKLIDQLKEAGLTVTYAPKRDSEGYYHGQQSAQGTISGAKVQALSEINGVIAILHRISLPRLDGEGFTIQSNSLVEFQNAIFQAQFVSWERILSIAPLDLQLTIVAQLKGTEALQITMKEIHFLAKMPILERFVKDHESFFQELEKLGYKRVRRPNVAGMSFNLDGTLEILKALLNRPDLMNQLEILISYPFASAVTGRWLYRSAEFAY